jgi:hypothetical protein
LEKLVASKQGFIFQEIKLEELHEKNFWTFAWRQKLRKDGRVECPVINANCI